MNNERLHFKVMGGDPDGQPWIMIENPSWSLESLGKGFLAIDLPKGSDGLEAAQRVAEFLNRNVAALSYNKRE